MTAEVLVPTSRIVRWCANFEGRHGATTYQVSGGALVGAAADGSRFESRLPFERRYDGPGDPAVFATYGAPPEDWGVLLVRKGGFAVARLSGDRIIESKVGQRHVQGRTKAGGQSQQRFARRRANQARQAYEAAAGHAARILSGLSGPLVTGGDRAAVDAVLQDPTLRGLATQVVDLWLAVPDPRRAVLESAVADACSVRMSVINAGGGEA